jgi:hypothetical protein
MKQKKTFTRVLAVQWCLLILGALLLLAACGGSSSPGAQPNSTPSNGGYSVIQLLNQESHFFLAPSKR